MDLSPQYSTIRLNSLTVNIQELQEFLTLRITKDYEVKGCARVSMWQHHLLPELLVIKNVINKESKQVLDLPMAVVDKFCGAAVLRGAHVFASGVLCLCSKVKLGDKVNVFADLDGNCLKGAKEYNGNLRFLGVAIARSTRFELFSNQNSPSGVGLEMCKPVCVAPSLDLPSEIAFAQNLPSVVASRVLDVKPGHTVLDMCAAPGGKTSHLALLMKSQGCLIALEKSKRRASNLEQFLQSCPHCEFVKVFAIDASKSCNNSSDTFTGVPPFPSSCFDRIMLDAPCSALGQRPQLTEAKPPKGSESLPAIQRRLFRTAVSLLRSGGLLVYSTCTTLPQENEEIVLWALETFRGQIVLCAQDPCLRPHLIDGLEHPVQKFGPPDSSATGQFPEDEDTIGFFIAKFQKVSVP